MARIGFFKLLSKAAQPLKTLRQAKAKPKCGDCSEKKTRSSKPANASEKQHGKSHEPNA